MKTLSKSILIVLCITLLSSAQLFGQEWSAEQKEVWAGVENWWQAWDDRDINKINSCIGEGFRGRSERFHAPYTMESSQPWWKYWAQNNKWILYDLTPVAIDIHDDISRKLQTLDNPTPRKVFVLSQNHLPQTQFRSGQ